jgi:hypothetical protein
MHGTHAGRLGVGVFAVVVALLACKRKDPPPVPTCASDAECAPGQSCQTTVSGTRMCMTRPPDPPPAETVAPKPKPSSQCAVIALSGIDNGKPIAVAGRCTVDIEDDGDTLKSNCPLLFRGKSTNANIQLTKKDEKNDKIRYSGTCNLSGGMVLSLLLNFEPDQLYTFANGQASRGKEIITATFRPCKEKDEP